jgi:hypothetical protein
MGTSVQQLLDQLAPLVQENQSVLSGGVDWSSGLWSIPEIIGYINAVCKDFVLRSQIIKLIAAVASVTGQRLYDNPEYTMQIDRIAFNNKPTYRTNRYMLDRENILWRTLAGMPKQYHQDQLPTKTFEVDRAPTSVMTGAGYNSVTLYGVVRFAFQNATRVTDAQMTSGFTFLNSATGNFTASDVGKYVAVAGAGPSGGQLVTTIASRVSSTQVLLTDAASASVSGAVAAWGTPAYGATLPGGGGSGVLRYAYGNRPYNGILPHDRPYAGTLRQALSGSTNFEVLATRLMDSVSGVDDLLRVPDYCVLYIKLGVLKKMLEKEGEGQDLARAKYCHARYINGVNYFRRLQSARHDQITITGPAQAVSA